MAGKARPRQAWGGQAFLICLLTTSCQAPTGSRPSGLIRSVRGLARGGSAHSSRSTERARDLWRVAVYRQRRRRKCVFSY